MKCRTVTKAFQAANLPLKLRAGRGYFIMEYDSGSRYETKSVMVYRLHQLTMEQWIEEGKLFAKELKEKGLT